MVKDYQNKEKLVLEAVEKFPLYSLNNLQKELPMVSRTSIQRILEKNDLSTVPKRLEFAKERVRLKQKDNSLNLLEKIITITSNVKIHTRLKKEPDFRKRFIKFSSAGIMVGLLFTNGAGFLFAQDPEIYLKQPGDEISKSVGEKIYVLGKVLPKDSVVTVNGEKTFKNGDGTFTAVIEVPAGESTLKIEAYNKLRKSELLKLVSRKKTQEELDKEKKEEAEEKQKTVDKSTQVDRQINDLLAVKNISDANLGIKILNNKIKEEMGLFRVVGEISNAGSMDLEYVMITARFLDKQGIELDSKFGFANMGKKIKPGETFNFETQSTAKAFDSYRLDVDWMDKNKEATESASQNPNN